MHNNLLMHNNHCKYIITKQKTFPIPFALISFKVLPHINPFSFEGMANAGDSLTLTCHAAKGDLPLKIQWTFNGVQLFAHFGVVTSKVGDRTSFLMIPSAKAENAGNYTCISSNLAGEYNYTAELLINGLKIN